MPWAALVVLLLGLGATGAVAWQLDRTIETKDAERFDNAVDRLADSIAARIGTYVAMLRAGAALIDAEPALGAGEFRDFVDRLELQTRYPGIQGIGWSRRVLAGERDALVAAQRAAGHDSFEVWPANPRAEYHSILFLEPLDRRNRAAIGYDMFTEPTRRAAMTRARDTGQPAASGPVTLVQEIDEDRQPGFLIYMPVYAGGAVPASIEERRARLQGFIYSPFRTHDLFAGIFGSDERPRAGFELYDAAASDTILYRTSVSSASRFTTARQLDIAGRPWTASFFSLPALEESSTAGLVPIVSGMGLALSLVVSGLVLLQTSARHRVERSERLTHQALDRAREQAATLEIVNDTGVQIGGELDLSRLVQAVTDAGTRLTRARVGAFFYNRVDSSGQSYELVSLSGVAREAFEPFDMPRKTSLFAPTFQGEGVVRCDDVTEDPRYGRNAPHHGMPAGHPPVRSYLAVPVVGRSGEVLGGLFFGHPERGVFTVQHERIMVGIAAQAAVAIDNARLYTRVQELLLSERSARGEAERVSRLKDEFLATLSHELRTPLNAIQGWAHLMSGGSLSEMKRRHAVDTILRNAQMQSQLIDDLLDMSRIISGRVQLETRPVPIGDPIDGALEAVAPAAQAKQIAIRREWEGPGPVVLGDLRRLRQVFLNLLANAVKFTPEHGRITIALRHGAGVLDVEVADTGIGIAPEFLPSVFERFRQADGSISRRHGGLGLGLSIVKSLVQMQGGTVWVSSPGPNEGATFTVQLPLAAAAEHEPGRGAAPPSLSNMTLAGDALAGLRILVVDDDEDARDLLRDVLTQFGAGVTEAASGTEALRILRATPVAFDVLASDLGMPGMDGFELIRRLREEPDPVRSLPAMAVTAYAAAEDRARALAAGYQMHLPKPVVPHEVAAACALLSRRVPVLRGSRSD